MFVETLTICITSLVGLGSVLWFASKFLTTAKAKEEKLVQEIHAKVDEKLASLEAKVSSAHEKFESDIAGLFSNQKNINAALTLKTPTRLSLMERLQAEMHSVGKK